MIGHCVDGHGERDKREGINALEAALESNTNGLVPDVHRRRLVGKVERL
jgi:hypothetical protein